ncbi:unnamed protein product, partial [Scytosiphon promiscuus]
RGRKSDCRGSTGHVGGPQDHLRLHLLGCWQEGMDDTISYGLIQTTTEMGGALTEAGAISAVAAFFRRNMDACAWTEENTTPGFTNANTSAPGAPPLLRFPLHCTRRDAPLSVTPSGSDGTRRPSSLRLNLVVSRGPGPDFSPSEARVASHAAVLLSQAIAGVRDRAALAKANDALEKSFRGMEEASVAVAALVEERDRRARHEESRRADLREHHEGAMAAAAGELEQARRAAGELRRQLVEAGEALAVVSGAAEDVCRAVAGVTGAGAGVSEVIAVIEGAARRALRCSYARVTPAEVEVRGAAEDEGRVWTKSEALLDRHRRERVSSEANAPEGRSGGVEGRQEQHRAGGHDTCEDETSSEKPALQVPIPRFGNSAEQLILSVRGASDPAERFTDEDKSAASALAACLGTALQALLERQRARRLSRRIEANGRALAQSREAAAACTADAELAARQRGERAVAGMRALASAARASRAEARAGESAARRARRQIDALRHLLLGLDGAGKDHAAVAAVVDRVAGRAVPGCEGAVLLTPRRGGRAGSSGRHGGAAFAPDPRAWVAAAVSRGWREENRRSEGDWRGGPVGLSKRAARKVEKAAVEAAKTGEAVCVALDGTTVEYTDEAEAGRGGEYGGPPSLGRILCFSPVVAAVSPAPERGTANREKPRPAGPSGRMRADELECRGRRTRDGDGEICGAGSTPCLMGWMLCPGTDNGAHDADCAEKNSVGSSAVSSLTDEAVVHAVHLALSSAAPAPPARRPPERSTATYASRPSGSRQAHEPRNTEGMLRRQRRSRDEELERLREGTGSLAERVRGLEARAAALRASEARSAGALAKARADVAAATGQLQLTALERDRLLRRLEETAEVRAPAAASARQGVTQRDGGKERREPLKASSAGNVDIEGVFRAFSRPEERAGTGGISSGAGGPVSGVPASSATPTLVQGDSIASAKECAPQAQTASLSSAVSIPSAMTDGASSAALQHMASLHARLSDSLKRGTVPPVIGPV